MALLSVLPFRWQLFPKHLLHARLYARLDNGAIILQCVQVDSRRMSPVSPPPLNLKALGMGRLPDRLQGTARLIYEDKNSQKAEGGGVLGKYYDRLGRKGLSGSHHSPLFCLAQEASLAFHKQGQCSVTEPPAWPSLPLPYHEARSLGSPLSHTRGKDSYSPSLAPCQP